MPFAINTALGIPTNLNVGGGIATTQPASAADEVPNKAQLDDAVNSLASALNDSVDFLQSNIQAKPSMDAVNAAIAVAVDAAKRDIDIKPSCKTAAIADQDVSLNVGGGTMTIGGVAVLEGDRVFLGFQIDPVENGTYKRGNGSLRRAPTTGGSDDQFTTRAAVEIEQGTYAGRTFMLATTGTITVGTTAMTWALVPSVGAVMAGDNSILVVGNAVSVRTVSKEDESWPLITVSEGIAGNAEYMNAAARQQIFETFGRVSAVYTTNQDITDLPGAVAPLDNGLAPLDAEIAILTAQTNGAENGAHQVVIGGGYDRLYGALLDSSTGRIYACGNGFSTKIFDPLDAPIARKYVTPSAIGDAVANVFTITHNLNTLDVSVTLRDVSNPGANWLPNITARTVNTVELTFTTAPTAGQFSVLVIG